MKTAAIVVLATLCCVTIALCQTETATISGRVTDPSGAAISGADVQVQNVLTGREVATKTNSSGLYVATALQPGTYRVIVANPGFKQIVKPDVVLNVQDNASLNFSMTIGSASEIVTVTGGAPLVDTQDATVSTVVDRNFAENMPMNGRSFQTLIELTPGVVVTPTNYADSGQFSVNGQRGASNYWMLDGVSANVGIGVSGAGGGNGLAGAAGSFSALGGTNSLVSVDALQEFRIQTSTFAPEFGRTPGAQISIATRSGTNEFHGTAFDYLRNDVLDASNWFNGYTNSPPLPKAMERQNDFGGTFSGPLYRNRTFFFLSYEGLRLRLPQTTLSTVPDSAARQAALPAIQPFLNEFPQPNGAEVGSGAAQFNASYSNPASLDAYSLRIDHKVSDNLTVFGRYNGSPSYLNQRGQGGYALSVFNRTRIRTQTGTFGATWLTSAHVANDVRFNYSRTSAASEYSQDNFGGAVPISAIPYPSGYSSQNASFWFGIFSLQNYIVQVGQVGKNIQRQINVVDSLSVEKNSHNLKFGIDFRRLSPVYSPYGYKQEGFFNDVPSAEAGNLAFAYLESDRSSTMLFRNLGLYGQDSWKATPRLTLTYGLRWDVDFAPSSLNGPNFAAAVGFNPGDLTHLGEAPAGTPPFHTVYTSVAPRIGIAYELHENQDFQAVVRGGFGLFYDLATSEVGNLLAFGYPFAANAYSFGGTYPLSPGAAAPPPIVGPNPTNPPEFNFADPNLRPPRTMEWNVAIEQGLGKSQVISATYIGAIGRKLLLSGYASFPNPNIANAEFVTNGGTSDYHALQVQFKRRLSRGLQALGSYSWSHSVDTGSAGSLAITSNYYVPSTTAVNRGSSDFDVRHALSAGITYQVPAPNVNPVASAILRGWSTDSFIMVRSAPPVDILDVNFFLFASGFAGAIRPDLVSSQPVYIHGTQYPGGKAFNPAAFANPPVDPTTGAPLRQGTVPRNFARGFGAAQWDFALHREFPIREQLGIEFRAEMFNLLNHPNFGPPSGQFGAGQFGVSSNMLAQFLAGGTSGVSTVGSGGFSTLYQVGGPRSIQLALKLRF